MSTETLGNVWPSHDQIAARAHYSYQERERLTLNDWYDAERAIQSENRWSDPKSVVHVTIADRAYTFWRARNGVVGSAENDWSRAERDLIQERFKSKSMAA